ncbi:MAG TPA: hypothetical protein VKV21_05690 [Solirubrobacteraceae bacterium]|nr:hypothetical protein [Solirubrobacteraceae bacterium]
MARVTGVPFGSQVSQLIESPDCAGVAVSVALISGGNPPVTVGAVPVAAAADPVSAQQKSANSGKSAVAPNLLISPQVLPLIDKL